MRSLFLLLACSSFFLLAQPSEAFFSEKEVSKEEGLPLPLLMHYASLEESGAPTCPRYDQSHQVLMGPDAVIDNCVNAITGCFFDVDTDLQVPGTDLTLTRTYCSGSGFVKPASEGDYKNEGLDFFRCWSWNHATTLYWRPHWRIMAIGNISTGLKELFSLEKNSTKGGLHKEMFKGWTNTTWGYLSGQSDIHNQSAIFDSSRHSWEIILENGTKRLFASHATSYGTKKEQYWFCQEEERKLPSGLKMHYKHHKAFDFDQVQWQKRSSGECLAYIVKKELTHFESSHGQTVTYYLNDYGTEFTKVPCKVERSYKPTVEYNYVQFLYSQAWQNSSNSNIYNSGNQKYSIYYHKHIPFLNKKILPEGRYLQISYIDGYPKLWVEKGNLVGEFKTTRDAGKVESLGGPLSGNDQLQVKYRFTYEDKCTKVTDACGGIREFHFDDEKRLTSIISKDASGTFLKRRYLWSNGPKEGYLLSQWATDASGKTLYYKRFEYDNKGNVTREYLHGDLTGRGYEVNVDEKGKLKEESSNRITHYEYSQDRFHCLKRELHQNGLEILYSYVPDSNLLMVRLEKMKGRIVKRNFQTYDDFGHTSFVIEDDGSGESPDDLTGVHVRRFKQKKAYENGDEIGLIQEESESYWDREQQASILLSRTHYTYYPNRLLKSESKWIEGCESLIEKSYEYDAHGNVIFEKLPHGATITSRYDANDNKVYECGPDLRLETYLSYDKMNRLIEKKEHHADGDLYTYYEYDFMSKLISERTSYGTVKKIAYDSFGRACRVELPIQMDENGQPCSNTAIETYTYDAFGRMTSKRDALGHTERYEYNCLDLLTFEHKSGQNSVRHFYDVNSGLLEETILGTGSRENYLYDAKGRRTRLQRYDENSQLLFEQIFSYEGVLPSHIKDNFGREEQMAYDGAGRLIEKVIFENTTPIRREKWRYDGLDRVVGHRQYANETDYIDELSTYDEAGKVKEIKRIASDGTLIGHECYDFDNCGRMICEVKVTGGKREEKNRQYNSRGKVTSVVDALGYAFNYEYRYLLDYQGIFLDHVIEYRPDGTRKEEWRTQEQLPIESKIYGEDGRLAQEIRFGYDPYKGVTYRLEKTLLEGQETQNPVATRVHFGPGRKVALRIDAAGSDLERISRWEYDENGLLKTAYLPSGITLSYTHDSIGLLQHFFSSDGTIDERLEHDAYGRATKMVQADGSSVERIYNALGQVAFEEVKSAALGSYAVEKSYDGLGRLLKMNLPYDVEVVRRYESTFLRSVSMDGSLGTYEHQFLAYDDAGRVLREGFVGNLGELERSYDALGRVNHLKSSYFESVISEFDSMGRVKKLERGFNALQSLRFNYDALGQLLEEVKEGNSTRYYHNSRQQRVAKNQDLYVHNDLSELLQVEIEGHEDQPDAFEYDLDGRLTSWKRGLRSYHLSYDAMNRLTQVTNDLGYVYRYLYDGLDRRIGKCEIKPDGETKSHFFIYDDQFELGSLQNDQWKDFRLIGLRSQAETGDTLLVIVEGKAYGTILDLQGSIVGWVDLDTRSLVRTCEYDAFGIPDASQLGPWGYVAKRLDPEMDLLFYGKRYYMPSLGRWLTKDPKGEIDGSNLYAFIKNNPVYNWDLWGLTSLGVSRPIIMNLSNKDTSHLIERIEKMSLKYEVLYPEKKRYNACFIAVIVDPEALWQGESNGILNTREECINRSVKFAIQYNQNIMSVYNTTQGKVKDVCTPIFRNVLSYDSSRPEYAMHGAAMDFGLGCNRDLGMHRYRVNTHSNGDHCALMGTNFMDVKKDAKFIEILALGTVGDRKKANEHFINYKGIMEEKDFIARTGRGLLDSSYIQYVNRSTSYGCHNHYIDSGTYDNIHHQSYQNAYQTPFSWTFSL